MESRRLDALTGVRFVAALHVIWFHFGVGVDGPRWISLLRQHAQFEVPLFMVLSGFLLTYRHAGRPMDKRAFYQARFARIYPLYAVSILATLLALGMLGELTRKSVAVGATQLLALHAWFPSLLWGVNDPSWSVSVEGTFYVLFPFVVDRLYRGGPRRILASMALWYLFGNAFTALGMFLIPAGRETGSFDFFLHSPISHLAAFMMGVGLGHLFLLDRAAGRSRNGTLYTLAALIGLAAFIFGRDRMPKGYWHWAYTHNTLLVPLLALLVYGLAHGGPIANLFARPAMVRLGEASYAFYLFQHPLFLTVYACFVHGWDGRPLFFVQLLAVLIPLSLLAHDLVETPAQSWLLARWAAQGRRAREMVRT
ncbi:MAG: acyltransferase family protein [Polyangiales bacterium]